MSIRTRCKAVSPTPGLCLAAAVLLLLLAGPAAALDPAQVVVVGNAADSDSAQLAQQYLKARGIPERNLILLKTTTEPNIPRAAFDEQIRKPLAALIRERGLDRTTLCLAMVWGIPLRVVPDAGLKGPADPKGTDAAVDSELALLWHEGVKLQGPAPNPLCWSFKPPAGVSVKKLPRTLMTARLDGPSRADAQRMIQASLKAEEAGLAGNFYLDAGGPVPQYDLRLAELFRFVRDKTRIRSVLDENESVFQAGKCPQAALYVGWSSPCRYVPAFSWQAGAVGWHIAAAEAADLRNPASNQWCPKMIQNGVAATIGSAADPSIGGFPDPTRFFPLLLTGKYTLAECYWRTVPNTSWRLMLIGDPLYNPYARTKPLAEKEVPESLRPVWE